MRTGGSEFRHSAYPCVTLGRRRGRGETNPPPSWSRSGGILNGFERARRWDLTRRGATRYSVWRVWGSTLELRMPLTVSFVDGQEPSPHPRLTRLGSPALHAGLFIRRIIQGGHLPTNPGWNG